MTGALFIGALVLAAALAIAYNKGVFWRREGKGWSAGPIIGGKNRSVGVKAQSDGSFAFPQPSWAAGHIHYLTKAIGPVTGPISARFRIEAAEGVQFVNDIGSAATVSLYVEREGNDWSARNEHERIYGPTIPLAAGEFTLEAANWRDWGGLLAETVTTEADVADVMRNAKRVGLVFGGGSGRGHGAFATGPARFEVLGFTA